MRYDLWRWSVRAEPGSRRRSAGDHLCPVDDRDIPGCGSSLWARLRFVASGVREVWHEYREWRRAREERAHRNEHG